MKGALAPPREGHADRPAHTLGRGAEAPAPLEPTTRRAAGWEGRLLVVLFSLGALAAALVLQPAPPGGALSLAGTELPGVCAFKGTTGVPCPGCGLTRSFVSAVRGDLATSLAHHLMGALIALYVVAQLVRHGLWFALPARRVRVERVGATLDKGLIVVAVALLLVWIPTLVEALRPPA